MRQSETKRDKARKSETKRDRETETHTVRDSFRARQRDIRILSEAGRKRDRETQRD